MVKDGWGGHYNMPNDSYAAALTNQQPARASRLMRVTLATVPQADTPILQLFDTASLR